MPDDAAQLCPGSATHPVFARFWAWLSPRCDSGGASEYRRRLLDGLRGRVLEVGAGNGLNFAHYPRDVTQVVAVEPEPYLRALAERKAARAQIPVEVVQGVADRLPAADATFDAVVCSLVLCSVPQQRSALREVRRVLNPHGELRFFEHVRGDSRPLQRVQDVLDSTVWPRLGAGCHCGRDTAAAIRAAGFRIERLQRVRFPETRITTPTSPHILGVARVAASA